MSIVVSTFSFFVSSISSSEDVVRLLLTVYHFHVYSFLFFYSSCSFFFFLFINGTLLQESEAAAFIMSRFEEEDVENSGFLPSERLLPILSSADLGLSRVQLNAIMSEARTDDQGFVQYADFAVLAAQMFVKIFDFRVAENNA